MAQATLAAGRPGNRRGPVATAIGLFAAIPAVVAYNRFSHSVDRLAVRFESFIGGVLQHPAAAGAGEARRRVRGEGGLKAVRSRRLMNEINIVPYVDVMLVLLVIFMVTRAAGESGRDRSCRAWASPRCRRPRRSK